AAPGVGDYDTRVRVCEIGDEIAAVGRDLRADGDGYLGVGAGRAVLARAPARLTLPRREPLRAPERGEVAQLRIGDEDDVAAAAAVAAVRPALRDVLLAPEVDRPVTAAPRDDVNARLVVKRGIDPRVSAGGRGESARGRRRLPHGRGQRARGGAGLPTAAHRRNRVLPPAHRLRRRRGRRPRVRLGPTRGRRTFGGRRARARAARREERELVADDAHEAAVAARAELHAAVARGENGVVSAHAGAVAGAEARSALADEDHPRGHVLAGEHLHAEHLRIRVATVPRRAESFLVGHLVLLPRGERRLERSDRALAVRVGLLVLERSLEIRPPPAVRGLGDLRDR